MLQSLHIENIAVIKQADLDLACGFTVLSGETGAGKSIVIDAIGLLLGGKVDRDLIRAGEQSAMVSGVFSDLSARTLERLSELGIEADEEGTILLQRTVGVDGKSKTRLNGRLIPVSLQRQIAPLLVDVHGQHDNQRLLDSSSHLEILDDYAETAPLLGRYRSVYEEMCRIKREMTKLTKGEREKAREAEMLRFQIADIDAIAPQAGEEEALDARRRRIRDAEKIRKNATLVARALYRNEKGMSAAELLSKAASSLQALSPYLPQAQEWSERLTEYRYEIADMGQSALALAEGEGDEKELDEIEGRLHELYRLKRKYGADLNEVIAYREKASATLASMEGAEERLCELTASFKTAHAAASELGQALHDARCEAAERLEKQVLDELAFLDMPKVRFRISLKSIGEDGTPLFRASGIDTVEMLISANPGEPLKPLDRIASGGELSRIMLAIKSATAGKDETGTMIFDEIDTGISGKTSQRIGVRLRRLGESVQVICITHSAQIAAVAHAQFLIRKEERDGRVETAVRELDREGRVREIARIMGGAQMTKTLMDSAEELLSEYNPDPKR